MRIAQQGIGYCCLLGVHILRLIHLEDCIGQEPLIL